MKKEWSSKWKSSTKPRKQRKYRHNAPLHIKRKFLGAHLSKELRAKYGKRGISLRKGDKIKVMRGSFKGHEGTVDRIDIKLSKIYMTGVEITKRDGSKVVPPIHASNVIIMDLSLSDKRREEKLKKKQGE